MEDASCQGHWSLRASWGGPIRDPGGNIGLFKAERKTGSDGEEAREEEGERRGQISIFLSRFRGRQLLDPRGNEGEPKEK